MKFSLSGNKQKIVNNLLWAVGGKVINLVGSLVLGIIVARYLGVEQYGLMNYVISYAFLFQTLASFGLDSIEVREEAAGKVPVNTIIGTAFWIKVVFGVICIALSIGTAVVMSEDGYTIGLVALYSSYIVFNSFVVIRNYFTSLVQNKYIVLSEIFRTFVGIAIKLTMWATDCSLTWFVAAFAFDHVLLAGGYISSYHHKIGKLKEWRFSLPYAKYLFSVAAKFVEVMIFIPATIAHTISPILVQMLDKSREIYTVKAQQYLNITVWVSILCSIGVSVISYWIVLHTFGTQYLHAAAILQVLSFKMVSVALSNGGGIMVIVERLQKWVFFRDVLGCLVCIGLNWWLLPLYGAMAAAFVAIAANLAAGYIADLLVPAYRHIFRQQTKALLLGWRDLVHIKQLLKS